MHTARSTPTPSYVAPASAQAKPGPLPRGRYHCCVVLSMVRRPCCRPHTRATSSCCEAQRVILRSESEKPTFPIGVLGPFSKQAFYVLLFDILSAKLDFESSNPILTTDLSGRSINSSCFGIDLFIYDEQASQVEARKGAHRPTLPLSKGVNSLVPCTRVTLASCRLVCQRCS